MKYILLITVPFLLFSCSKKDEDPIMYGEENPFSGFLATMPEQNTYVDASEGVAQWGYVFKPKVNGKINSITIKIPDVNPKLEYYIWDAATKALVFSSEINASIASTDLTTKLTAPINLKKDKEYVITLKTADYYFHTKNSGSINYPVIVGNIEILGTRSASGELYPEAGGSANSYSGNISFNFQRTD